MNTRTIRFTLNGEPVSAEIANHHSLVEVLRNPNIVKTVLDKNGNALFPMMQYKAYRSFSDEDAKSILVYIRTLAPVKHAVPARKLDFPVNLLIKLEPKPLDGPVSAPDPKTDRIGYGRYLSIVGGCQGCHTPHDDKGKLVPGKDYTGG